MNQALTLTVQLERAHIPPSGGTVHLLVQVSAPAAPAANRPPLNVAAVIDRSGSMAGAKLHYTLEALCFLIDQMAPQDRLAVVDYDHNVRTLAPSAPVIHKDALKARVRQLEPGGTTNLSGGLATGMQQITPHAAPGWVSRVLLMTDGLANVGVTDPEVLVGWARTWRERGLTLSTLGVGQDFNEDLLVALAEAGGGRFHYIDTPERVPAIFAEELEGLLAVVAQGLHLRVEAEAGVAIERVIGYPAAGDAHKVELGLSDIYAGEVKSVVLALAVAAPPANGRLARVTLQYLPVAPGAAPEEVAADVAVQVTTDPALLAAPPDPVVERERILSRAAEAQEEAVRLADAGNLTAGAAAVAEAMPLLTYLAEGGDAEAAERLASLKQQVEALSRQQYDADLRKRMRQESHQRRSGRRPG